MHTECPRCQSSDPNCHCYYGLEEDTSIIFVFGSNLAGRHGKGAALHAKLHHGAVYGVGVSRTGSAYALPTKDANLRSLPLADIRSHALTFRNYVLDHPELTFQLTRVGCGLAGYTDAQIAPMFANLPKNVRLPSEWVSDEPKDPS